MNRNRSAAAGFAMLMLAGLAGCSADEGAPAAVTTTPAPSRSTLTPAASPPSITSSTVEATSGSPMVGGMTECTKAALAGPATAAARALGPDNLYAVDELNCAGGWAVTSGLLSSKENPAMGAPTSFLFQQEGQFWVVQDKSKVCGTNPTSTTAPADAAVPAALYIAGCASG